MRIAELASRFLEWVEFFFPLRGIFALDCLGVEHSVSPQFRSEFLSLKLFSQGISITRDPGFRDDGP